MRFLDDWYSLRTSDLHIDRGILLVCDSNDIEAIEDKLALFSEIESICSVINLETESFYNNKTKEAFLEDMIIDVLDKKKNNKSDTKKGEE